MICRRARLEDVEAIARVHVASWHTTYAGIVPQAFLDDISIKHRSDQWRRAIVEPIPGASLFVAEVNGSIVGFANAGPSQEKAPVYKGELYAIYLLKEAQRRGIGHQLVSLSALGLLNQGITSMLLWVLAENPACKFYEALGGKYVREKQIEIGGANLIEVAYGWNDVKSLVEANTARHGNI